MAKKLNITIDQGADYELNATVRDDNGNPYDLTGFTITSEIRDDYGGTLLATFTSAITDAVGGAVTLSLDQADTATLPAGAFLNPPPNAVYDVKIDDGVVTKRVLAGRVSVNPSVTA